MERIWSKCLDIGLHLWVVYGMPVCIGKIPDTMLKLFLWEYYGTEWQQSLLIKKIYLTSLI